MIKIKNKKGFTLIELLVVVAIISLMSSIVLASLNGARGKAADARVKSQLLSIRNAAEIYYSLNNNSYGPATTINVSGCAAAGSMFTNTASGMAAVLGAFPAGTLLDCGASNSAWSVAATLKGGAIGSGPSWCVDSTGVSRGRKVNGGTIYNGLSIAAGPHSNPGWTSCQ